MKDPLKVILGFFAAWAAIFLVISLMTSGSTAAFFLFGGICIACVAVACLAVLVYKIIHEARYERNL